MNAPETVANFAMKPGIQSPIRSHKMRSHAVTDRQSATCGIPTERLYGSADLRFAPSKRMSQRPNQRTSTWCCLEATDPGNQYGILTLKVSVKNPARLAAEKSATMSRR